MPDIILFFGRFHPLVLHLPIGLLAGVVLLESVLLVIQSSQKLRQLIARTKFRVVRITLPGVEGSARMMLTVAALSACFAAILGLMLAARGDFEGDSFVFHKWLGIGTALGACLAALLRPKELLKQKTRTVIYCGVLFLSLNVMSFAGHFGGVLVHGEKYLSQYAPALIPSWMPVIGRPLENKKDEKTGEYAAVIRPMLETHCIACHGANKVNGNLRLDDMTLAAKPAQSGQVGIKAGNPSGSEVIRRLLLPHDHAEYMPPAPEKKLSAEEVITLAQWIEKGAKTDEKIEALAVAVETPITQDMLKTLEQKGILVYLESENSDNLIVDLSRNKELGDSDLALVSPLASRVVDLNVSNTKISDAGCTKLLPMPRLLALRAHRTALSPKGVSALIAGTPLVTYIDLVGTSANDDTLLTALEKTHALRELNVAGVNLSVPALSAFLKNHSTLKLTHELMPLPDLSRPPLAFVAVSSEETKEGNFAGANLFDGDVKTIWTTRFQNGNAASPYEITFENTHHSKVDGFVLHPRLGDARGAPNQFVLEGSNDRKTWVKISEGILWETYDNMPRAIVLPAPDGHFFFRLKINSTNTEGFAALAEVRLLKQDEDKDVVRAK